MPIPIIDIFAGPGGLGEGFSSVMDKRGKPAFDIKLSIEKDERAYKTLLFRSFYRKLARNYVPHAYYEVLREADLKKREAKIEELFESYPDEASAAKSEVWMATLGGKEFPSALVDERIRTSLNSKRNWVLIGGPPCQAYSLVGRSRNQQKDSLNPEDHRVYLYREYLRIIAVHHPAVFVMENVKGMLSAKLEGESVFQMILSDLKKPSRPFPGKNAPNYRIYSLTHLPKSKDKDGPAYSKISDFLVRCEEYGIPQKRHRVILVGIREDIKGDLEILEKEHKKVTVNDVIGDLPMLRGGIGRSVANDHGISGKRVYNPEPNTNEKWEELVTQFREEIVSWNGFDKSLVTSRPKAPAAGIGSEFVKCKTPSSENPLLDWYKDERLGGVCNHESRAHMVEDLRRYQFAEIFTQKYNRFPRLDDVMVHSADLMPEHKNATSGKFNDRFRVQLPAEPGTTVTSHISKDGHYFIHPDPNQCRSFTVREAARIQTFPDNYLFRGGRTAQFHQVGNAVPPLLAKHISEIVHDFFLQYFDLQDAHAGTLAFEHCDDRLL